MVNPPSCKTYRAAGRMAIRTVEAGGFHSKKCQIYESNFGTFLDFTNSCQFVIIKLTKTFWKGGTRMRKSGAILRILCGILDGLIIMIPIQMIMMGIFEVSIRQAELFFQFLFAVYGTLFTEYWGQSLGKYFGRLKCADANGGKAPILYVGVRELVKSLYIVPVFGWAACGVSIVMMFVRKDGRTLHDLAGNTKVVSRFEMQREGERKDDGR